MNVFPPRNLPGSANEWGRAVENSLASSGRELDSARQSFSNLERATGGQLSKSSNLVTELLIRSTEVAHLDDMSTSGAPVYQTHTFSSPSGGGTGFLVFQAQTSSNPLSSSAQIVAFIRTGETLLMRVTPIIIPGVAINPVESSTTGTIYGFCRFDLPAEGDIPVTVQLSRGSGPASTVSLLGVTLSLTRSGV